MNEQKEQEQKQEDTTKNTEDGDKSESFSLIEATNAAAERVEKANAETREIQAKEEELYAKRLLGGKSEAGITAEKKEVSNEDFANQFLDGKIENPFTKV